MSHGDKRKGERASRLLFDSLIAPVSAFIASGTHLVIVADETTMSIPFAALRRQAGAFLIEEHSVRYAPSIAVFKRTPRAPSDRRQALVVAPSAENVESLGSTIDEASAIAAHYAVAKLLTGEAASSQEFKRLAPDAEIIHFAGHGRARGDGAAVTSLLFSGRDAAVDTDWIERLRLDRRPIVVLAGCNTARGEVRWGEGTLSVARAFLVAGSSSVIATMWPIDDRGAAQVFPRLHDYIANGVAPDEALRAAQIDCLRGSTCTADVWAAIQVIGR
jgi:CHAT domain-containing protein